MAGKGFIVLLTPPAPILFPVTLMVFNKRGTRATATREERGVLLSPIGPRACSPCSSSAASRWTAAAVAPSSVENCRVFSATRPQGGAVRLLKSPAWSRGPRWVTKQTVNAKPYTPNIQPLTRDL